jgi:uncharacterized membrane protein
VTSGTVLIRLAPPVIFVLLVHTAALLDQPVLGVAALAVVCFLNLAVNRLTGASGRRQLLWAALGGLMILVLIATLQDMPGLAKIILLPPVLMNGLFLVVFGCTLLPGREPLITRFSRLEWDTMSDDLNRYTRRLTIGWTVLFALSLLAAVLFAVYADLATWSWFVNLGAPAVCLFYFLAEHLYRIRRFGADVTVSPVRTIRVMLRPEAWSVGC